jgi:hypothetical protein
MGRTGSMCGRDTYNILVGGLDGKDHFKDLGIDIEMDLKGIVSDSVD